MSADPPPPPPGFPEALVWLRWVRGTYLDQMVLLEMLLDADIVTYFAISDVMRPLAYASLTRRLGLRAKTELMTELIAHSGLPGFDDIGRALAEAVPFRNKLAHARVSPSLSGETGQVGVADAVIVEWSRGDPKETPFTPADVERHLDRVPTLYNRLWEFMSRLATVCDQRSQDPAPS